MVRHFGGGQGRRPPSAESDDTRGAWADLARDLSEGSQAHAHEATTFEALLDDLSPYRRIFFPLRAGTGVLRFAVPRWLPPFRSGLEFIGHSGISGTVAFVCRANGRIIVGTVNQLQDRARPYRMMMKAGMA